MKIFPPLLLLTLAALLTTRSEVRALLAYDDAGNYGGSWSSLDNKGFGFGPWFFWGEANPPSTYAGAFIGDPTVAGITGMGNEAFGLYANPSVATNGPSRTVFRSFAAPLAVGNTFSFQWGLNWDSGGTGSKGFTLFALVEEGLWQSFMGVRQGDFPGTIEINAPDAGGWTDTGIGFGTGPMTWTVTPQSPTSLLLTSTARDGSTTPVFTTNYTTTRLVGGVGFHATNLAEGNRTAHGIDHIVKAVVKASSTSAALPLHPISIGFPYPNQNPLGPSLPGQPGAQQPQQPQSFLQRIYSWIWPAVLVYLALSYFTGGDDKQQRRQQRQ
jgi:hypothetical protein